MEIRAKLKTVVADVSAFSESIRAKIADLVAAMEASVGCNASVDIGDVELVENLLEQCKEFYEFGDYMDVLERIYALMRRLRGDE